MPSYPRTSKYTAAQNSEMRVRLLDVLTSGRIEMTTDDIKSRDIMLADITNQKLSRELGTLVEMGLARKCRSKARGRMVYKATSVMIEEGYE